MQTGLMTLFQRCSKAVVVAQFLVIAGVPVLNFSHAGGRVEDVDTALAERYSLR